MNIDLTKYNNFWLGFVPGLFLPPLFIWAYMSRYSPFDSGFVDTMIALFPSILLGKILLLSAFPNLALMFVFYKTDSFKLAAGILSAGMPYLISSFFML